MTNDGKTHYKKAFNSPYLSSDDIEGPTALTIKYVELEPDKTKRSKDKFNTAYFAEREIRPGEVLKPMVLNRTNSKTMKKLTGSSFLEDWKDVLVSVYVDPKVKMMGDVVSGLRISPETPKVTKPELIHGTDAWTRAIASYKQTGSLDTVKKHMTVSAKLEKELTEEVVLDGVA